MGNGKQLRAKESSEKDCLFDLLIHDLTGPLSIIAVSADSLLNKPGQYGVLEGAPALTYRKKNWEKLFPIWKAF